MRSRAVSLLFLALLITHSASAAKNIFEDDWTPPTKTPTPAPPPKPIPPTPPPSDPAVTPKPPAPPVVITIPIPSSPTRRAIPAKADQARSRALLKEVYAKQLADRTLPGRRKLARDLLDQAAKSADNPSDQFVLLGGAVQAGIEAASVPISFEAADSMASAFQVDSLSIRADAALKINYTGEPARATENVRAAMELIEQLAAAEDFTAAARLGQTLQAAPTTPEIKSALQQRLKELTALRVAYDRLVQNQAKLKAAPNDPAANFAVGSFYAFLKNDWETGLPLLAKASTSPAIAAAAVAELGGAKTPDQQIALADNWWTASEKEIEPTQGAIRRHAAQFYTQALQAKPITGLARARIDKRIGEAARTAPIAASTKKHSILAWRSGKTEDAVLSAIAEGRVKAGGKAEVATLLADSAQLASYTIIVFSTNRWRELKPEELPTSEGQANLQTFVKNGGELIFFEQFAMGNMSIIDKLFNFKTGGGPGGAIIEDPELKAKLDDAGYNDAMLKAIQWYNTYHNLPEGAKILVRANDTKHSPAAVIIPYGKGRLIMIGSNWDKLEAPLNAAILQTIYHYPTPKP